MEVLGEGVDQLQIALVGNRQDAVALVETVFEKGAELLEHPRAVARRQVVKVDIYDQVEALIFRHIARRRHQGGRSSRAAGRRDQLAVGRQPFFEGLEVALEEVGDLDLVAIFEQFEIVGREVRDRSAVVIGDKGFDVDDVDIDPVDEGSGGLLAFGQGGSGAGQPEKEQREKRRRPRKVSVLQKNRWCFHVFLLGVALLQRDFLAALAAALPTGTVRSR